jgi:hypothetical protein
MSKVADNNGNLVEQEPVLIDAQLFHNFVMSHADYFEVESHTMQHCVELILERGRAEIVRQIKTAVKTKENKVYGDLARQYNMTLEQAKAALSQFAKVEADRVSASAKK